MRIATFNVQNLRLRHPDGGDRLDGARDGDEVEDPDLDPVDRRLTAAVIRDLRADVVALQEVFDAATLDHFHDRVLVPSGVAPYPHRVCLPGNDGRGLDVAVMSRVPLGAVASHAGLRAADLGLDGAEGDQPVFRRDCLMVEAGALTLFICHFKAPWPDAPASWPVRRQEAEAVRRIVEGRCGGDDLWLIAGDLNDPDAARFARPRHRAAGSAVRAGPDAQDAVRGAVEPSRSRHGPAVPAGRLPRGACARGALARCGARGGARGSVAGGGAGPEACAGGGAPPARERPCGACGRVPRPDMRTGRRVAPTARHQASEIPQP